MLVIYNELWLKYKNWEIEYLFLYLVFIMEFIREFSELNFVLNMCCEFGLVVIFWSCLRL